MKKTIIVLSASLAGLMAAVSARKADAALRIIMVEETRFLSWSRLGLARYLLEPLGDRVARAQADYEELLAQYSIESLRDARLVALDIDAQCLIVQKQSLSERIFFDALVYAGGFVNKGPAVPGLHGSRVVDCGSLSSLLAIDQAIAEGAKKALVLGAGARGVEVAFALAERGLRVEIIEQKKRILPSFSLPLAQLMLMKLKKKALGLRLDCTIAEALDNNGLSLSLSNQERVETDLVVICSGISPKTALLAEAGAAIDPSGLIRVDEHMATTLPKVYACGGAVSVVKAHSLEKQWMMEPAVLNRGASVAGHNAAKSQRGLETLMPFAHTKLVRATDTLFARTGLSEEEAREAFGDDQLLVTTDFGLAGSEQPSKSCIRLIIDRASSSIIGAELMGQEDLQRHIDLLALAIVERMPLARIVNWDLAHETDEGALHDPLLRATSRALNLLKENIPVISAEKLAMWLKTQSNFRLLGIEAPLLSRASKVDRSISATDLDKYVDEIKAWRCPIVLYCKSGFQSYLAQRVLLKRGMTDVYHLDGGMQAFTLIAGGVKR